MFFTILGAPHLGSGAGVGAFPSLAAGQIALVSNTATTATLTNSLLASGGVPPLTYQWQRRLGAGVYVYVTGGTGSSLVDSGPLTPGSHYYYKRTVIDSLGDYRDSNIIHVDTVSPPAAVSLAALWAGPAPAVAWTLTREEICDRAMLKCEALGVGEPVTAADRAMCLQSLDMILKNLAWRGVDWPKLVAAAADFTLLEGRQDYAMPPDFYRESKFFYFDEQGYKIPIYQVALTQWNRLQHQLAEADYPQYVYVDQFNVAWFWPVPQRVSTLGVIEYQKIVNDTVAGQSVDLDSPWMLGLVYGVAAEIGYEFHVDKATIADFNAKWELQIALGTHNAVRLAPEFLSVDC